jgi:hypothetical protein
MTEYYSLHAPPPFHKLSSMFFLIKSEESLSIKSNCVKYIIYNKKLILIFFIKNYKINILQFLLFLYD